MEEILGGGRALGALQFSSLLSPEKCGHAVRYVINPYPANVENMVSS